MVNKNHSIVFIDSSYEQYCNKRHNVASGPNIIRSLVMYFTVPASDLPKRIFTSFVPPLFGEKSHRVYVDFVGPCLAILTLAAILHYGHAYKLQTAASDMSPSEVLLYYCTITPVICFILARIGRAALDFTEIVALLGYGLYGDLFTLAASQAFDHEQSNFAFFMLMFIFACPSAFRIALVLLTSIPHPAARLIVCSTITLIHLIFLIFVHFAYMHRTFVYGINKH
ncbi:protein YIPF3-like [Lycorma delicatula]|uniref:protein YIPF3-like n=1 Tax=Lycorma delicatula TaxID=130591 RepID=UPI003F514E7A